MSNAEPAAGGAADRRRRLVGIGAAAVLVAVALILATQGGDGGDEAAPLGSSPHFVDVDDLTALEDSLGHFLYWAGEREPAELEVREEADGSVYLRYLPAGVEAGDPRQQFLTIGTYPVVDPVDALRRTAAKAGVGLEHANGAVVLVNPTSEGSAYFAYPGSDLQVEVYDPAPGRSLELIRSGAIRPVG